MIAAFRLEPVGIEIDGEAFDLRRPTVADFVALADATQRGVSPHAWYVWNHVERGGRRVFGSVDEVANTVPLPWVLAVSREIDALYGEGLDCRRAGATSSRSPGST
jgi:hypothetical protein